MNKKNLSLISQLKNFGIAPVIGMAISFFTVPVTTRLLLPIEFGKSSLFSLVQNVFQLLAVFGFDQAYVRFYNEESDKQKLIITSIALPSIISFLAVVFVFFFRNIISKFMFGSYEPFAIVLLCLYFMFCNIYSFAMLSIRMSLRGKLYSFITLLQQILSFVFLLFLLIFYERSFRSIIYASVFSTVTVSIISIFLCKSFSLSFFKLDIKLLKRMVLYGLPLVPSSLLVWIMNSFDRIALRNYSTFKEIGLYAAAFKIVALLNIVQTIFSTAWAPIAFSWHSEANVEKKRFEDVNVAVCSVLSLIFSGVVVCRNIIFLLLGSEYRNTEQIFIFLMFTPVLYTLAETSGLGIYFSKKTYLKLVFTITASIFNIAGNNILVPYFGAVGAAVSTAVCYSVWFWGVTFSSRKNWFKFRLDVYIIDFMVMVVFSLNMLILKSLFVEIAIFIISLIFNLTIFLNVFAKQIRLYLYSLSNRNIGNFRKLPKVIAKMLYKACKDSTTLFSLKVQTYDGSNQAVHPDVILFNKKLVLTCTPYPLGFDYYENPSIFYGDSLYDLKPIRHNPVAVSSINRPGCHLCDPCLLNYCGDLYLFYLDFLNLEDGHYCDFYKTKSSDIKKWSKSVLVKRFEVSSDGFEYYVSPAFIVYGSNVFFFAVHWKNKYESTLVLTRSSSLDFDEKFSEIDIVGIPNDFWLYHINICFESDGAKNHKEGETKKLLGLFLLRKKSEIVEYKSVFAVSENAGAVWQIKDDINFPNDIYSDSMTIYKGTIVPYNDKKAIKLVFSYRDKNHVWKLCTFPYKYL